MEIFLKEVKLERISIYVHLNRDACLTLVEGYKKWLIETSKRYVGKNSDDKREDVWLLLSDYKIKRKN